MKFSFLPIEIEKLILSKFNYAGIYEIRIRQDKPIFVLYYGDYILLKDSRNNPVYADKKLIEYVVTSLTEMSIYRYNNQIKQGFITYEGGGRVGISGEIVLTDSGEIRTIKNIKSLVIRVPHEVKGCASSVLPFIETKSRIFNTLIISPPGCGKTTMLRDIARLLSFGERVQNIMIVDERYEIAGGNQDVGSSTDVFYGGNKEFCFENGIRAMAPSVIITDEIGTKVDAESILKASYSGVAVIASVHARDTEELRNKPTFKKLIDAKLFDRYIVLSSRCGVGTIESVIDKNFCVLAEDL